MLTITTTATSPKAHNETRRQLASKAHSDSLRRPNNNEICGRTDRNTMRKQLQQPHNPTRRAALLGGRKQIGGWVSAPQKAAPCPTTRSKTNLRPTTRGHHDREAIMQRQLVGWARTNHTTPYPHNMGGHQRADPAKRGRVGKAGAARCR